MSKNVCIQAALKNKKKNPFHSKSEERNDTALTKESEDMARVTSVNGLQAMCHFLCCALGLEYRVSDNSVCVCRFV